MRVGNRLISSTANLGLDNVKGARHSAARNRVDNHHQLEFVEQLVREMYSADSVICDSHVLGHRRARESSRDLNAKTVVTEKDVADSCN